MTILETKRLRLRRLTMDDVPNLLEIMSDTEAMRFYPSTLDEAGTAEWLQRMMERIARDGTGFWAVELKESGEFVGLCGLLVQEVDGVREIEVGYMFVREHWGNGYATEAARECMAYGFERLGCRRIISIIHPDNIRSRKVAERNGLGLEKETVWRDRPAVIYAIDKNGWHDESRLTPHL